MRLGFIGCGNMGKAMLGGILKQEILPKEEIIATALHPESREHIQKEYGISVTADNREAARAEMVILAVKPQYYEEVIREIRDEISEKTILISIAPGKTHQWFREQFQKTVRTVRCMPNTPAMVGEGITGVCLGEGVTEEEQREVLKILSGCGKAEIVPEHLMDVVAAVSGSSPAYVFLFLEALADGAVAEGMPRKQAYRFAAQAVLGSAAMMLETGKHPGELKDMVCSPGGTTIEAVSVLEAKGMRSAVIEAVRACAEKSRDM